MVMKLTSGSQHKLRQALWSPVYSDVLEILNGSSNAHTLAPMGDDYHGKLNAADFTGRRFHASGLEPTWTLSSALSAWDTPPSYEGPKSIPVITFNGSDEHLHTPDNALWTRALGAMTISAWIWTSPDAANGWRAIMTKYDGASDEFEWAVQVQDNSDYIFFICYDKDAASNASIQTVSDAAVPTSQWAQVVCTYDGSANATGMNIYINGGLVASTDTDDANFVSMRDTTERVAIGSLLSGGSPTSFFGEKMAGGPLGPLFVQGALTAEQIQRLYQIGRAALLGA